MKIRIILITVLETGEYWIRDHIVARQNQELMFVPNMDDWHGYLKVNELDAIEAAKIASKRFNTLYSDHIFQRNTEGMLMGDLFTLPYIEDVLKKAKLHK